MKSAANNSSQGSESGGAGCFRGTEAELLRVARDVSLALAYMHKRTIVHMDVKVSKHLPGNLTPRERPNLHAGCSTDCVCSTLPLLIAWQHPPRGGWLVQGKEALQMLTRPFTY